MPTTPAKSKSTPEPVTASGIGDPVAKGASPEDVQKANAAVHKEQAEKRKADAQAVLDDANRSDSSERQYVEDEDGISRLAAAKGQPVPAWAEKLAEKTGGLSNEPKRGPEATA